MIRLTKKQDCCGCAACVQACPKGCLTLRDDEEGFPYPAADTTHCTHCGLCERVCPMLRRGGAPAPRHYFATMNPNKAVRHRSSSGGIFSLLAEEVLRQGGVVFGARFDAHFEVVHDYTEEPAGLAAFRGAKYLQSRIGNNYRLAQEFLRRGRLVLFSGTPCQIAALKLYLRRDYDNLIAVEIVCHGVPSPMLWRKYLAGLVGTGNTRTVTQVNFRDKLHGWKGYHVSVSTDEGVLYREHKDRDPWIRALVLQLTLRPACTDCPAKIQHSSADITLGDCWGIDALAPELDDDAGCSVVICNQRLLPLLETLCPVRKPLDAAAVHAKNPSISRGLPLSRATLRRRQRLFRAARSSACVRLLLRRYTAPSLRERLLRAAVLLKHSLRSLLHTP